MISLTYNHKMIITINLVNIYHSYRYKIKEIEKKITHKLLSASSGNL